MKDSKYFNQNVIMAVEVEYGFGGRNWKTMKGCEVKNYCNRTTKMGNYISDIDYCAKQEDEWCRKVLNTADYNFRKNYNWCKKKNLTSLDEVVDYIIEHQLVAL